MKQIKKTILTLVALLAVTTGAWADETPLLTIESKDYTTFKSGSMTFDDMVTVTFSKSVYNTGSNNGWFTGSTASLLTVAGINGYTITSCKFYTENGDAADGYTVEGESPSVYLYNTNVYTDASQLVDIGYSGVTKIEVYGTAPSASSGTTVPLTWDATAKTATLTNGMPAGNVTVSVDYFPKATADGAVTAATDVKATTDAPLVTVDATMLTGATKMMYYVSTSTTAPAYGAEGWTDVLPTAEKYTEAGTVNVWYYPVGTDEGVGGATATYSDGDMNATALAVTLGDAPTYNVEFAEDNPEPDKWSADPNTGVKKGQTVTVTYSGQRKVIGVKAEKKAAAELPKYADVVTICEKNGDNEYLITSFFDGTNANITTITKEEAIALAEYLGGGNIFVVYEEYGSSYRYVRATNAAGNATGMLLSTTNTFMYPLYYVPAGN